MKFRKYHPPFVTLSGDEELEYEKRHDVQDLAGCLEVLYPHGPYAMYHGGMPEEKTINLAYGYEYFIDTEHGRPYPLMACHDSGTHYVIGLVESDEPPAKERARWDEDKDRWDVFRGVTTRGM